MSRLGCARMLLGRSFGKPEHPIVSRLQSDAIVDLMKAEHEAMECMSPDNRCKMSSLAVAGKWAGDDLQKVLPMIEPPAPKGSTHRPPMQKATPMILNYFTAEEWLSFNDKGVDHAMQYLITRLWWWWWWSRW